MQGGYYALAQAARKQFYWPDKALGQPKARRRGGIRPNAQTTKPAANAAGFEMVPRYGLEP